MPSNQDALRGRLFSLLARPDFVPVRKRRLARLLEIPEDEYVDFRHYLDDLVARGELAERKHGKFGLPVERKDRDGPGPGGPRPRRTKGPAKFDPPPEAGPKRVPKDALIGKIDVARGGFGFLLSDPPGRDLYIAREDLGGALSGDLVAVIAKRTHHGRRQGRRWSAGGGTGGSRPAGRVVEVLERAHPIVVGTFHERLSELRRHPSEELCGFVVPDTRGLFEELEVLPEDRGGAQSGDKVAAELVEPAERNFSGWRPTARVVQVYGEAGEARAEIAAVIKNFDLRTEFPPEVLAQAEALREEVPEEELAERVDYTSPVTFTIDPADAKDHDDAVALREGQDGRKELLVHIADVAHFVPEGSPVDLEARARGTSVYLPGQVLPMLPPKLSGDLCSLREGRLRLTLTAAIVFSRNLQPEQVRIERSYIRSAAFLTYDRVQEALDADDPGQLPSAEVYETLRRMRVFAAALRRKRLESGSIDLDLPEVRLVLDEHGVVTGWTKVERHWAHELIEDMMLAANRAVAEYLVAQEVPGLFRVHEEPSPEALENFAEFVREFGVPIHPPYDRMKLKSVLERVRGKEFRHAVHLALLTSLKQAVYAAECRPHFALNFTRYLHFTSPIRRYPDLLVHRALQGRFAPGQKALTFGGKRRAGGAEGQAHFRRLAELRPLAVHCSHRERQAAAAEQEVTKFRQLEYLRNNERESHPGVIAGVRDFGLFVELQDCYVEGLVRVQDLGDDFFEYSEKQHLLQGRRRGRSFRLGDKVSVRVVHIDLGRKQVGLVLV